MKVQEDSIVIQNLQDYLVQEHIMRYIFASGYTKDKVVLDIACGTGYGSNFLRKAGAKEVFGVDVSAETIRFASLYYKKDEVSFFIADATGLPFENSIFDVVISFETIEHLGKYRDFLIEVKRVLKPEGCLICSTPNKRYAGHHVWHAKEFYAQEFFELLRENFIVLGRYAQYTSLASGVRAWAVTKISLFLSFFHFGDKVRDFAR
jgi:2-polyprenyl-3-methyl-5-hydroxy-6-metoxy-1,4-benzoquinol methylase